jgi:putative solute:sodium symporter small subunit
MQKRFIADAAHQMKTPLAGMRMQSELALRQVDPDEIHRSLEQLAKSSESATRLVNQLLALARAENQPHAGLALEALDLGLLARERGAGLGAGLVRARIDLGYEAPAHPVRSTASAMMLRELLSNLIDNALRYTPAGGSVTVRVRASGDAGAARSRGHRPRHRAGRARARVRALLPHPRFSSAPAAAWAWRSCARSRSSTAPNRDLQQPAQHAQEIPGQPVPPDLPATLSDRTRCRLTPPSMIPLPIPTCAARASSPRTRHWRARAAWSLLLVLWLATSFCTVFFARDLAHLSVFGWPLSFYLAAQGASLVYLAIIGVYAWRMRRSTALHAPLGTPHERRRPEERRESRRQGEHAALFPRLSRYYPGSRCASACSWWRSASSKRKACRASGSATCSCSPPSCCTPPSAWSAAPRTSPNTTWRDGACRRCSTAWPPPPTGSRRPASSAWPAACTCTASTPSPTSWAGPAATAWWRC